MAGDHPLIPAWWIPPAAIGPLQVPDAVNAAGFPVSGNPAWVTAAVTAPAPSAGQAAPAS